MLKQEVSLSATFQSEAPWSDASFLCPELFPPSDHWATSGRLEWDPACSIPMSNKQRSTLRLSLINLPGTSQGDRFAFVILLIKIKMFRFQYSPATKSADCNMTIQPKASLF